MHIIIIGGGITGISTYLALRQHLPAGTTIKLYESHPRPTSGSDQNIGGGLGLAPNALRALSSISPAITERLQRTGFSKAGITFRNADGKDLGVLLNGSEERYGFEQLLVPRAAVHDALLAELDERAGMDIAYGRKVVKVEEGDGADEDGTEVRVEFADGGVEVADVVLGADGVWSAVRRSVLGERFAAEYQGLTGLGGFIPLASLSPSLLAAVKNDPLSMTFGPDGFFGCSLASPVDAPDGKLMWWSTYATPEPPSRDMSIKEYKRILLQRHGPWISPHDTATGDSAIASTTFFRDIIELACAGTSAGGEDNGAEVKAVDVGLLILPVYTTPRLPTWSSPSGRILLLGDAAHAMPPDAGHGVAAGVEDALAISMLLREFTRRPTEEDLARHTTQRSMEVELMKVELMKVKKAYEELRMPRLGMILDFAKRSGDGKRKLGWWGEVVRDWVLWAACRVPEGWTGDWRFGYDVGREVRGYLLKAEAELEV